MVVLWIIVTEDALEISANESLKGIAMHDLSLSDV